MQSKNLYIITGGPGVGKTTLIEGLANLGYRTVPEDARRIIKSQIELGGDGLPWKDKNLYARLMFDASLKAYDQTLKKELSDAVFFDRGILDAICYMRMEHITIPYEIDNLAKENAYNRKVFILPPWKEIYETDEERKQNWEEAEATYDKMNKTYLAYGYYTIEVPKISTLDRILFVLKNID